MSVDDDVSLTPPSASVLALFLPLSEPGQLVAPLLGGAPTRARPRGRAQEVAMLEVGWKPRRHTRFSGADRLALTITNKLWDGEAVPLVRGYAKGPVSRGRGLGPVSIGAIVDWEGDF